MSAPSTTTVAHDRGGSQPGKLDAVSGKTMRRSAAATEARVAREVVAEHPGGIGGFEDGVELLEALGVHAVVAPVLVIPVLALAPVGSRAELLDEHANQVVVVAVERRHVLGIHA